MQRNILFYSMMFFFSLLLISCSGGGADCSNESELANTLTGISAQITPALLEFSADPSDANCDKIKDLYLEWIEDIESIQDCAAEFGQADEFALALDEARTSLSEWTCD